MVVSANGSAMVVYESDDAAFGNHYQPGVGWSGPFLIDKSGRDPLVAANPDGHFIVGTQRFRSGSGDALHVYHFTPAP